MTGILGALAPVGLVIAFGWALRRAGFPGDGFWAPAERLTYYVLFPALIVNNLGAAPFGALPVAPMAGALAAALMFGAALMMALRPRLAVDGPAFSSLFQGVKAGPNPPGDANEINGLGRPLGNLVNV